MEIIKKYGIWIVALFAAWFMFFKRKAIKRRGKRMIGNARAWRAKRRIYKSYHGTSKGAFKQIRKWRKSQKDYGKRR